jgi:hypothetical protein
VRFLIIGRDALATERRRPGGADLFVGVSFAR